MGQAQRRPVTWPPPRVGRVTGTTPAVLPYLPRLVAETLTVDLPAVARVHDQDY
jgi:hypothetical protein